MGDLVSPRQRGQAVVRDRLTHALVAPQANFIQQPQTVERRLRIDAEINQAGNFVHANRPQLFHHPQADIDRAEEAAVLEIPVERVVQQGGKLLLGQVGRSGRGFPDLGARRQPCWGETPRRIFQQINRAFEIVAERFPNRFANGIQVLPHKSVQHQGDVAVASMAVLQPGLAVNPDLFRQVFDLLPHQVSE